MSVSTKKRSGPLWDALFPVEGDPNLATYAIIDGAACESILEQLEAHDPDYCCLYAGELEPDVEEVAPYLVRLEFDHPFTSWLLEAMGKKPWGIFCKAPSTLRELRKHFRQFLMVKGPEGENLYFRYYDPRVLSTFLPTCELDEILEVFGPIDIFLLQSENLGMLTFRHAAGNLKSSAARTESTV